MPPRAVPRVLGRDRRGIAAMEFAFIAPAILLVFMNVVDLGSYIVERLEVENAAQMAAQAAWRACGRSLLPATINCPSLNSVIDVAIRSTTLGTGITLSGSPSEGYYCVTGPTTLQYAGPVSSAPPGCTATGMPTQPGDYLTVAVSYRYVPKFPGLSASALLPTPIIMTARMRLG
jgi:hypothetical protein